MIIKIIQVFMIMNILWNVYIYFLTYANATNWEFTSKAAKKTKRPDIIANSEDHGF